MFYKTMAAAAVILTLAGCQTAQPPTTASGRPEVTIQGAAPAKVKAAILSGMLDKGYRIVRDDQFSLSVERPVENIMAVALLSTGAGGAPVGRITYTVAQVESSTRVVADLALVQNAGMAFERRTDVSQGNDAPLIQAFLDQIKESSTEKKVARR